MSALVKICGLTSPEAVEAAVESGADAVGFVFAESVRRIAPASAAALVTELPPGVVKVAVMRHPSQEEVDQVMDHLQPEFLQTDAEDFEKIRLNGPCRPLPVFRAGGARPDRLPALLLFEGPISGSGKVADWSEARAVAAETRLILAGGLRPDNVADAMRRVRPYGLDVSSGVESAPGIKCPSRIREFLEAVRDAERNMDFIGEAS